MGAFLVECMDRVAQAYALGNGVEKNVKKAKEWAERSACASLQQKAYISEFGGPGGYTGDCLDFFMSGELIPDDG